MRQLHAQSQPWTEQQRSSSHSWPQRPHQLPLQQHSLLVRPIALVPTQTNTGTGLWSFWFSSLIADLSADRNRTGTLDLTRTPLPRYRDLHTADYYYRPLQQQETRWISLRTMRLLTGLCIALVVFGLSCSVLVTSEQQLRVVCGDSDDVVSNSALQAQIDVTSTLGNNGANLATNNNNGNNNGNSNGNNGNKGNNGNSGAKQVNVVGEAEQTKTKPSTSTISTTTPGSNEELELLMQIYTRGELLDAVQMTRLFEDSKHFVDMPIRSSTTPKEILMAFKSLKLQGLSVDQRNATLQEFVHKYFDQPGGEFLNVVPSDYQQDQFPSQIAQIKNETLRDWAFSLHKLWKELGRTVNVSIKGSFLIPKHAFDKDSHSIFVVPGGRFRETYYWDSYWIVHGLLVSDMKTSARSVVQNLLDYCDVYGFVPNGGRIYYLTRSQPPMLSDMVRLVATNDDNSFDNEYLKAVVPTLEKEYTYWMQTSAGGHALEVSKDGQNHMLNRYMGSAGEPRPESYREDVETAANATTTDKVTLYNHIIAAAESGWDFSSRWFQDRKTMPTIHTTQVVPVELNVIMHRFETNLKDFHQAIGNEDKARTFEQAAAARAKAIDAVFWQESCNCWKDYDLTSQSASPVVSVSDYSPLWSKEFTQHNIDASRGNKVVKSLRDSGLIQIGGIQTTTLVTKQQWDAPNAWPPEQDIVVDGLLALNTSESTALAKELVNTWVTTGLIAFKETGLMFEKYNATLLGGLGKGGEYVPQFGFGWTNGVILKFLSKFGDMLRY